MSTCCCYGNWRSAAATALSGSMMAIGYGNWLKHAPHCGTPRGAAIVRKGLKELMDFFARKQSAASCRKFVVQQSSSALDDARLGLGVCVCRFLRARLASCVRGVAT